MAFSDILNSLFSAALTVFLALSPVITQFLTDTSEPAPVEIDADTMPQSPIFSFLSTFDEIIREQLRSNEGYQQATVLEGTEYPSPDDTTTSVDKALVNIFCTAHIDDTTHIVTSSGVFIDEDGVILTNAHIAQFLLLSEANRENTAQCVVRQGSPAISKYKAGLLYISPTWIAQNADQLYAERPSGTGEYDFALLYVTNTFERDETRMFPSLVSKPGHVVFDTMKVRAAGYPAEALAEGNRPGPLVPVVATTTVTHLYTFNGGEIDLVGLASSIVGQQGSSGGPILDEDNGLVGLIVTRGNVEKEGERSLRALTISYINRMLLADTGLDLAHTLTGDIALRAKTFQETIAPRLQELLLKIR